MGIWSFPEPCSIIGNHPIMAPIPTTKETSPQPDWLEPGQRFANKASSKGRKFALAAALSLLTLGVAHAPLLRCYHQLSEHICHKTKTVEERARHILAHHPLIGTENLCSTTLTSHDDTNYPLDGHVDLPVVTRFAYGNRIDNDNFTTAFEGGDLLGQVDLYRLRKGLSGGAFWSVYAPCPENATDFSDENYAASLQFTLDQIDVMKRLQSVYPGDFSRSYESDDALPAFQKGKLISPLGVEGLHQIANSASNLRRFHDLGVRYATLTHNCNNKFADAAIAENPERKAEPTWGGVSPLGRQMVHEMNRIGMIVDLAHHPSEDTMIDVLGGKDGWSGSQAPVIFSHSSAWSICPHPRNVKDHVLELVKDRSSVVMVNAVPQFISCIDNDNKNGIPDFDPEHNTLDQIVKHIMHIGNLIGFDHVGIGSDFDGMLNTPRGFEDVTKYPDLVAALLKEGVSDADAAKIVGGNVLRVWADAEAVALTMQLEREPVLEDERKKLIPGL
ncbi:Dipeptidase sirJ [Paramyrothecium foliicola]|nr:Dipeptidase sirJ [Paramyrothecium foliicola]